MIEMRWLVNNDNSRRLQYRQKYDVTIRAGLNWSNEDLSRTANYQWSDWHDVPEVWNPPTQGVPPISSKCPKCSMDLSGPMGYVCSHPQCPTGLGSSMS
jgi:hypothetical protein